MGLIAALMLAGAGTLRYRFFDGAVKEDARAALDREWSAMKAYLRLERGPQPSPARDFWYYDERDPDQSAIVTSIRGRCVIMDQSGTVIHESPSLPEIRSRLAAMLKSPDAPDTPKFIQIRRGNVAYMVRTGFLFDESRRSRYPAALAIPLARNRSAFAVSLLGTVLGAAVLGWSLAQKKRRTTS